MMDINKMNRKEFDALPCRDWGEDIGKFDSLVILPTKITFLNKIKCRIITFLNKYLRIDDYYLCEGLHDSGYRLMDFVAVKGNNPICRLSGCSDVIHINGIGGLGHDWLNKYGSVPDKIKPASWCIDCLPESGLLRLFSNEELTAGGALSSFEIYSHKSED